DPRDRSHPQAYRCRNRTAFQCPSPRGDPFQTPVLKSESPPYVILKYRNLWLSDSVQVEAHPCHPCEAHPCHLSATFLSPQHSAGGPVEVTICHLKAKSRERRSDGRGDALVQPAPQTHILDLGPHAPRSACRYSAAQRAFLRSAMHS